MESANNFRNINMYGKNGDAGYSYLGITKQEIDSILRKA